jgi:hypothetical protein
MNKLMLYLGSIFFMCSAMAGGSDDSTMLTEGLKPIGGSNSKQIVFERKVVQYQAVENFVCTGSGDDRIVGSAGVECYRAAKSATIYGTAASEGFKKCAEKYNGLPIVRVSYAWGINAGQSGYWCFIGSVKKLTCPSGGTLSGNMCVIQ